MYPQEKQVCSLDQAKKLVELGVVLDTYFIWEERTVCGVNHTVLKPRDEPAIEPRAVYPAPNVAELGVLLTFIVKHNHDLYWFYITKSQDTWRMHWKTSSGILLTNEDFANKSEAQARAEALIWLLENGHLKPEDLKL